MKSFKPDDKQKMEILKIYPNFNNIRYGLWINPHSKSVYRHKPIDFLDLGIQCEVPKNFMSHSLIMKAFWYSADLLTNNKVYSPNMTIVIIIIAFF